MEISGKSVPAASVAGTLFFKEKENRRVKKKRVFVPLCEVKIFFEEKTLDVRGNLVLNSSLHFRG